MTVRKILPKIFVPNCIVLLSEEQIFHVHIANIDKQAFAFIFPTITMIFLIREIQHRRRIHFPVLVWYGVLHIYSTKYITIIMGFLQIYQHCLSTRRNLLAIFIQHFWHNIVVNMNVMLQNNFLTGKEKMEKCSYFWKILKYQ